MGTELGVRFRRRVSVNEQGRRQQAASVLMEHGFEPTSEQLSFETGLSQSTPESSAIRKLQSCLSIGEKSPLNS